MARQSRPINPTAGTRSADAAQALRQLDRVTSIARKNRRVARAAASVEQAREFRWQPSAGTSVLKQAQLVEGESLVERGTARDGSRGGSAAGSSWGSRTNLASAQPGRRRAAALVEASTRSYRQIPELSQAMKALARIERPVESGSAGRAILEQRKYATPSAVSKSNTTGRAHLEARQPSFVAAGIVGNVRIARSIRAATLPASISQREFAQPSGDMRGSNQTGGRSGITINSSPTVVINGPASGAMQNDVIGALRAYREELFDEMKRESARRERAQF
jgi:hypothetical protein